MSDMTDLQQLAAACKGISHEMYRKPSGIATPMHQMNLILDAHADDPKWFPVKFKVGDWVKNKSGDFWGLALEINGISVTILKVSNMNQVSRWTDDCRLFSNTEVCDAIRTMTNQEITCVLTICTNFREHFEPRTEQ